MNTVEQVTTTDNETSPKAYEKRKTIFRAYQVVWFFVGLIEVLLAFRVLLKLVGANYSTFTTMIYLLSAPFARPFLGTLDTGVAGEVIVEWSTLLAMAVYPLLAIGIIKLFQFVKPTTPQEVERKIDK